jgi:hypothetical protein
VLKADAKLRNILQKNNKKAQLKELGIKKK